MRIRRDDGSLIVSIPRRPTLGIRGLLVLVALSAPVLAYATSYVLLSRRGMSEARVYGLHDGFLYVPFEEAAAAEDLSRHHALTTFYAPANWIDRTLFGGHHPIRCIIWRLSG